MDWRPFYLHPEIPPGGVSAARIFGPDRTAAMNVYMARFAGDFGVEIGAPDHVPNTRRALAVTEYARDHDRLAPFRDAAMDAHWLRGMDIEADDVLGQLAEEAGLDRAEALAAADDSAYLARLDTERAAAQERMVNGIPVFFFGDAPVVGCQPYESLALMAERSGFARRQ